jgi:hypothetical protein
MASVTPLASARGFRGGGRAFLVTLRSFPHKPPAEAGGVTRCDHGRGGWANARMGMARVTPLASARSFWLDPLAEQAPYPKPVHGGNHGVLRDFQTHG